MDLWKYHDDVNSFNTISEERRQEIIKIMLTEAAASEYYYISMLCSVIKHLDNNLALKLFNNYILYGSNYTYDTEKAHFVVKNVYARNSIKSDVKNLLKKSKNKSILRTILMLEDISYDEEELGLRALSGMKYAPDSLFINRYKPSVEAVKKLPPVMRLKAIESLLSNNNISYNILENFSNSDEFKSLLFGAVLRHNDRVNTVCKKYHEVINRATQSITTVKGDCENCGKYSIAIKSTRVGTITGLNNTRIGQSLQNSGCALCGRWGQQDKQIVLEK
ncbi:hypothetical protein LCGC14_2056990 [marine sediment metagenome]|uniref:Uncharacterized protein n=1 Tax=marine sediment metagenome TaxID=412755 RepID=A0A0F9EM98_9ZZZZ